MIRNTTANSEYIFVFVVCFWDIYCGSQYRDEQQFGHVHSLKYLLLCSTIYTVLEQNEGE